MIETRGYSSTEIYDAIQASELDASIKALSKEHVKDICDYMIGKAFSGVTIGQDETQKITYTPPTE